MEAEIDWLPPRYRRYCEIVQLWHRLVNMDTYRLTHKVFLWDLHLTERLRNTWCGNVKTILNECDLLNFFNTDLNRTISAKNLVDHVNQSLINIRERQWTEAVLQSAKLRTYRTFKPSIGKEEYLDRFLSIQHRSAVARFLVVPSLWPLSWAVIDGQLSLLNSEFVVCAMVDKSKMRNIFLPSALFTMQFVTTCLDILTSTTLQMNLYE